MPQFTTIINTINTCNGSFSVPFSVQHNWYWSFTPSFTTSRPQVVSQKGADVLLKLELADFSQLTQGSGGAYGSSLNSSASNQLSSLDLGGLNRPEHGMMLQEKHDGREIPVSTVYYFAIGGQCIEANKGEVLKYAGEERKAELTRFIKEKKVKWKNEDSLKTVLEYLSR